MKGFSSMVRALRFFVGLSILAVLLSSQTLSQQPYDSLAQKIVREALVTNKAYEMLHELCTKVGTRLSGSAGAAKAVIWGKKNMEELGFENVHLEPVMVPHWMRGTEEKGFIFFPGGKREKINITALGGSIATPKQGIVAEVIEVKSFEEVRALGAKAKGKIIFFNRPMDRALISTGAAYGGAVNQRGRGAVETAAVGGVAALVRSMTTRLDDYPHTGAMGYVDSIKKVPTAAISTIGAERLSKLLASGKHIQVYLKLSAETLPDVESANVVGELRGTEKPEEVIVMGGHLDSWDKGQGAHDDGTGIVHSLEALRLLKSLGVKPKRTIRVVLFMNEENGLRGGTAYASKERPGEKHIAAIESDGGGFTPRGFGVNDSLAHLKISGWASTFSFIGADKIQRGGGGADISPLMRKGVPGIGLNVDGHRYFDYHHSDHDTIDKVNERELALGAAAMSILAYMIAQEGL